MLTFKLIPSEMKDERYTLCIDKDGKVSYCGPYTLPTLMDALNEVVNEKAA